MTEATQQPSPEPSPESPSKPPPEPAAATVETGLARTNAALAFARRHPAWTVLGIAGAGLIGGIELAAGVVIGAGVAAMLRARGEPATVAEPHEAGERAHTLMQRLSPEVKRRTRAVIQAVRGDLKPVMT
ncbi:MAG TPA: hypothetical protein VN253_18440 [Kofleriaceae bacterium]|nr:hypothetical protein [Kofleriaceae bacterium]